MHYENYTNFHSKNKIKIRHAEGLYGTPSILMSTPLMS